MMWTAFELRAEARDEVEKRSENLTKVYNTATQICASGKQQAQKFAQVRAIKNACTVPAEKQSLSSKLIS